jgi:hypothetical protein
MYRQGKCRCKVNRMPLCAGKALFWHPVYMRTNRNGPVHLARGRPQDRPGSARLGGPQAWWDIWPRAPEPPGELRQRSVAIPARGDDNDLVPGVCEALVPPPESGRPVAPPPREAPQRPPARAAVLPQGPCIQDDKHCIGHTQKALDAGP